MGIMDRFKDIRPIGLENLDEVEVSREEIEQTAREFAEWKAALLNSEEGRMYLAELDSEK